MKSLRLFEKFLKRFFKEKMAITVAVMVVFLITGNLVYGETWNLIDLGISGQESLTLSGTGDMKIKNSNILFNKDTDLKLKSNTEITSSKIVNEGTISALEGSENLYILNAQSGDTAITNNGNIISRNGGSGIVIGGANSKVINNGIIDALGDQSKDREWITKGINLINSATVENNGAINVHEGTTSGSAIYVYSGTAINGKDGKINLLGENSKGLRIYGGVINGADLTQKREVTVKNEGEITGKNIDLRGIEITKISGEKATIENTGIIDLNGDKSIGISASRVSGDSTEQNATDTYIYNSGIIRLNGKNAKGISITKGIEAINTGTIALNVFADEKYSGNIAIEALDGGIVSSTGTIQLTDLTVEKLKNEEMIELENFVKDKLVIGGTHTGIITNSEGKTILSAGDTIGSTVGDLQEGEVIKAEDTVVIIGKKIDGTLNIGENFLVEDGKFLAKVESEELSINGTINSGNSSGIDIGEGNIVNLTGTINSDSTAINLQNGASLNTDGASIKGDITSVGDSNIELKNETNLAGNIILGAGNDNLTIDSSTGNVLTKDTIIDGGSGEDTLNLGTEGKVTTISSTILNFDNQNLNGIVVLDSDATIKSGPNSGKIAVGDNSLLVIRISEDKNNALTDISGNTIRIGDNSKIMLETNNLKIGSDGKSLIDLGETKIVGDEKDLIASQYIYDIAFEPSRMEGSLLNVSLKSLDSMGISSKYQKVFDSIVTSENLSSISSSTELGNQSALENLLGQVTEMNPYSLSMKMSRESILGWNNGIRSLKKIPKIRKWIVQATVTGNYEDNNGGVSHNSYTTGLLATGEYGIMKDASLGFAFGGGKQLGELKDNSSSLESDSFYFAAFTKRNIENFRFMGSLGYQKNKFDAKRILDNGLNRFDFDKTFDTEGFNLMGEVRYIKSINETLTVEPKLVLDYTHLSQSAINENEKPMGISVDSVEQDTYGAEIGVDIVKNFSGIRGQSGKIYAGVAYGYTSGDTDESLKAKIGKGSKFDIEGTDMGNSRGKATIGVEFENSKGFNYGLGYTYEVEKDAKNSKVTLGLGYKF